jgi:hypothetical protein
MSADERESETPASPPPVPVSEGRLVRDPCEPVLVPGGRGKHIVCGRMRTAGGEHILDQRGSSG